MLPGAGLFHFPWEVSKGEMEEGAAVRTFGRLVRYDSDSSEAILSSLHGAVQCQVLVCTSFVEPFHVCIGAHYIVLGEIEKKEGPIPVQVRARVLTCVDGINLSLLEHAVQEQRKYFSHREVRK